MGCKQILPDPKTKAWVDEQNRINTEKTLDDYDKSYKEARDTMHPDPQIPLNAHMKESLVQGWIPLVLTQKIDSLTVRVKV